MVVTQVVGVGIFLTPATMMRTLGGVGAALVVWAVDGHAQRCRRALLRRARHAVSEGWRRICVPARSVRPARGVRLRLDVAARDRPRHHRGAGYRPRAIPPRRHRRLPRRWSRPSRDRRRSLAFGAVDAGRHRRERPLLRWTAIAKLAMVGVLVTAAVAPGRGRRLRVRGSRRSRRRLASRRSPRRSSPRSSRLADGGSSGRMSDEVESPRRTMPLALRRRHHARDRDLRARHPGLHARRRAGGQASDEAFVADVGHPLFGDDGRTAARRDGRRRRCREPRGATLLGAPACLSGHGSRRPVPAAARSIRRRARHRRRRPTLIQVVAGLRLRPARHLR